MSSTAFVVDSIAVSDGDQPTLRLAGTLTGAAPQEIELIGARQRLAAPLEVIGERWSASLPLLGSRWGGPPLPPPSGRYRLDAASFTGAITVRAVLPDPLLIPDVAALEFAVTDTLELKLTPPLYETERGPAQQSQLEAAYRAAQPEPINAVFFESFYGQNASCNPLAIDRELRRQRPDVMRYWSVADASVAVPEGAVRLIEGSEQWWRVRASARLLVVNDWLRNRYRKREHQTVLQTWHGTPLKRIALSRRGIRPRPALASLRERSRWNIMLSQNPHSTRTFRRAYAYFGPIWQDGYPRNDILVTGDAAAIRRRLGIADDVTVLLYAPTWRDDRPDEIDHLQTARFAQTLGDGYVTLIRGHARTLRPGTDVRAPNVIDVTSYPDISELFLVADALITDYSSVMFDYTVTGKPVLFFTPDLADYRDRLRGFYFDLLEVAPGPVANTSDELLTLVRELDSLGDRFAPRYRAWQQQFNPNDDGQAAARVLAKLLERGAIS
ncbi:CDP-glycerol glycerophosphotransferase family protein [Salinibacterium sp. ZJ450]|uniref:CDP-glycerol glycerophosphotransferase family protein n=1 Tax=Salinibacterium sp. ZJ450 TaxID=2708338 RepID=UPI001422DE30|nr:CDP-glycerol glycerophosphotransferase family protein [Salinibacterium sp. ZJ450]